MAKLRSGRRACSIPDCTNEHRSLFLTPSSESLRRQWIKFIFQGSVKTAVPKLLYVCAHHFAQDCFVNESQFRAGFATRLRLKNGSVPTVRDATAVVEDASTSTPSLQMPTLRDFACQTDKKTRSVGTQLSLKTFGAYYGSAGVQGTRACRDFGVSNHAAPFQFSSTAVKRPLKRARMDLEEELEEEDALESSSSVVASKGLDSTFDPAESIMPDDRSTPTHQMKKYIVYESNLMELFAACRVCARACHLKTRKMGTFLSVEQQCPHCEYRRQWNSQPVIGSTPAGNLHLSAAIYLSGASFFKMKRVFESMHLQFFHSDTFRRHARSFIEPAVIHHWQTQQNELLHQLSQEEKVVLGGDMRTDSPGHLGTFGSYTTIDLNTNTIVDMQLIQSDEVGGRHHMEKEGLKRSLASLGARGVTADCVVTRPHPQIHTFLMENKITHYYEVRHVAKGISKQLKKISKMKDCEKLQKWMKSINSHVYWTAATSATGPERVAKWTSILNHVLDIHEHEQPLFPACLHESHQTRDKNKWLSPDTSAFYRLEKVIANKRILEDVAKLSPHYQTSSLEAFQSVILHFAPKHIVFPFIGLLCRLYLAAMHYNENDKRPQAQTDKVHLPKALKGECRAKPPKMEQTFRYVVDMMDLIFNKVFVDPLPYTEAVLAINVPDNQFDRPDKQEVIDGYVSLRPSILNPT
ncbi:uncharacterized protein LOC144050370 [Vanacampus margaritifer]